MRQEVFELYELLETARVSGPLVLVGQSIGGLLVRLIRSSTGATLSASFWSIPRTRAVCWEACVMVAGFVCARRPLGEQFRRPGCEEATNSPPTRRRLHGREFQKIYISRQANPQPFGDHPLIVLGAGKRPPPPGTSDELWKTLRQEKEETGSRSSAAIGQFEVSQRPNQWARDSQ